MACSFWGAAFLGFQRLTRDQAPPTPPVRPAAGPGWASGASAALLLLKCHLFSCLRPSTAGPRRTGWHSAGDRCGGSPGCPPARAGPKGEMVPCHTCERLPACHVHTCTRVYGQTCRYTYVCIPTTLHPLPSWASQSGGKDKHAHR